MANQSDGNTQVPPLVMLNMKEKKENPSSILSVGRKRLLSRPFRPQSQYSPSRKCATCMLFRSPNTEHCTRVPCPQAIACPTSPVSGAAAASAIASTPHRAGEKKADAWKSRCATTTSSAALKFSHSISSTTTTTAASTSSCCTRNSNISIPIGIRYYAVPLGLPRHPVIEWHRLVFVLPLPLLFSSAASPSSHDFPYGDGNTSDSSSGVARVNAQHTRTECGDDAVVVSSSHIHPFPTVLPKRMHGEPHPDFRPVETMKRIAGIPLSSFSTSPFISFPPSPSSLRLQKALESPCSRETTISVDAYLSPSTMAAPCGVPSSPFLPDTMMEVEKTLVRQDNTLHFLTKEEEAGIKRKNTEEVLESEDSMVKMMITTAQVGDEVEHKKAAGSISPHIMHPPGYYNHPYHYGDGRTSEGCGGKAQNSCICSNNSSSSGTSSCRDYHVEPALVSSVSSCGEGGAEVGRFPEATDDRNKATSFPLPSSLCFPPSVLSMPSSFSGTPSPVCAHENPQERSPSSHLYRMEQEREALKVLESVFQCVAYDHLTNCPLCSAVSPVSFQSWFHLPRKTGKRQSRGVEQGHASNVERHLPHYFTTFTDQVQDKESHTTSFASPSPSPAVASRHTPGNGSSARRDRKSRSGGGCSEKAHESRKGTGPESTKESPLFLYSLFPPPVMSSCSAQNPSASVVPPVPETASSKTEMSMMNDVFVKKALPVHLQQEDNTWFDTMASLDRACISVEEGMEKKTAEVAVRTKKEEEEEKEDAKSVESIMGELPCSQKRENERASMDTSIPDIPHEDDAFHVMSDSPLPQLSGSSGCGSRLSSHGLEKKEDAFPIGGELRTVREEENAVILNATSVVLAGLKEGGVSDARNRVVSQVLPIQNAPGVDGRGGSTQHCSTRVVSHYSSSGSSSFPSSDPFILTVRTLLTWIKVFLRHTRKRRYILLSSIPERYATVPFTFTNTSYRSSSSDKDSSASWKKRNYHPSSVSGTHPAIEMCEQYCGGISFLEVLLEAFSSRFDEKVVCKEEESEDF